MLLTDLLRHFPELTVRSGGTAALSVSRLDVLPAESQGFRPQPGTLYLHSRPETLPEVQDAQELLLITGRPKGKTSLSIGLWLTHPDEQLPLNLSARLLRVLYEHGRTGGQEREEQLSEVLEELLGGECARPNELLERAERLGAPLARARQVLLVAQTGPGLGAGLAPSRDQVLREVRRLSASLPIRVAVARIGGSTALLFDSSALSAHDLARNVSEGLTGAFPQQVFQVGVGNPVTSSAQLCRSYHEARAALEVAPSLPRLRRVVTYEDVRHLLIYREIRRNPQLLGLIGQTIAPLKDMQGEYGRTMLETLAAYLEHGRSPARAAAALGVHPNTMKYRMKRIGELLDIENLSGGQQALYYLAAHLALQDFRA